MYIYICVCVCVYIYIFVCAYIYMNIYTYAHTYTYTYIYIYIFYALMYTYTYIYSVPRSGPLYLQPIAFVVSFNLNLQSQSYWSLFNGTYKKRPTALDYRLRFENLEMTPQMR